jgi:hypothetical protein
MDENISESINIRIASQPYEITSCSILFESPVFFPPFLNSHLKYLSCRIKNWSKALRVGRVFWNAILFGELGDSASS